MSKVTHDKFGDAGFARLYDAYAKMDLNSFIKFCQEQINDFSSSSTEKKRAFNNSLQHQRSKDRVVKMVTDFYMAGQGFKVIS